MPVEAGAGTNVDWNAVVEAIPEAITRINVGMAEDSSAKFKCRFPKKAGSPSARACSNPDGYRPQSQPFTGVAEFQLELPALETHQHTPELIPGDFPAVDDNEWHATLLSLIPLDPGSHHFIGNLQSVALKRTPGRREP
jgi:hypothetical protein